jgi:hypothetical protein
VVADGFTSCNATGNPPTFSFYVTYSDGTTWNSGIFTGQYTTYEAVVSTDPRTGLPMATTLYVQVAPTNEQYSRCYT